MTWQHWHKLVPPSFLRRVLIAAAFAVGAVALTLALSDFGLRATDHWRSLPGFAAIYFVVGYASLCALALAWSLLRGGDPGSGGEVEEVHGGAAIGRADHLHDRGAGR